MVAYRRDDQHSFLHIYAISTKPTYMSHVATYHLPRLMPHIDISTALLTSSPVSLDGSSKLVPGAALLEDGEGIFTLCIIVVGHVSDPRGNAEPPWQGSVDACMLIRPFHEEATSALVEGRRNPKEYLWGKSGPKGVHWTQSSQRKARQALCGYRKTGVAAAPFRPGRDKGVACEVEILDFNPVLVKKRFLSGGLQCLLLSNQETQRLR